MRKLKAALYTLAAGLVAAAAAQGWLYRQTALGIDQFAARESAWLRIGIGRYWLWPWGTGWIKDLSLQPEDWYNAVWQLPLGFAARVERIDVDRVRRRPDGSLDQLDLRLHRVHLPVPELWGWTYPLGAPDGPLARPPSLYALGYTELLVDADLKLRFEPDTHGLDAVGTAAIAGFGRFAAACELDAGAEVLDGDSSRLGLRRCRLRFDNAGAATRFEQGLAQQARIGVPQLQRLLIGNFDRWARHGRVMLDDESRKALRAFLRHPQALELIAMPVGPIPLYKVRGAAPEQWCSVLGLSLRLPYGGAVP